MILPDRPLSSFGWIMVNSSGGKDSQTALRRIMVMAGEQDFPRERIVVFHADLGRVEWAGARELALLQAGCYGLRTEVRKHRDKNGEELDLLEYVRRRGKWPSPSQRFCTSTYKRDTGKRVVTVLRREFGGDGLNVLGFRAEESPARRKRPVFARNGRLSTGAGDVFDFLPIHDWTEEQVWEDIESSGIPYHPAYDLDMPRLSCCFCLSGTTEVVTREGLFPIKDIVGRRKLLIPKRTFFGLSGLGAFKEVEIRAFGTQRVFNVCLRKERQTKVVGATAEHRWFVAGRRLKVSPDGRHRGYDPTTVEKTTSTLVPGDVLRSIRAEASVGGIGPNIVPFAVAQGFIFGDGSCCAGDERPALLTIYSKKKDGVMLKFFAAHAVRKCLGNGKPALLVPSLPRLWKEPPDFRESRSFLLSWLSGYFAADGCVSAAGQATLSSASLRAIGVARSIAAVCGIGYGPVTTVVRRGKGKKPMPLHKVTFRLRDLPEWFFHIEEHARRACARGSQQGREIRGWEVVSVTEGPVEQVYCATVPGSGAFALSDELMTGNCIFAPFPALVLAGIHNRDLLLDYVRVERETGHRFTVKHSLAEVLEAVDSGVRPERATGKWNM